MRFDVKILGSNSALPSNNRYPSSQCLSYHDSSYLIDCGEGCQMQLSKYKVKRSKINQIFISHLHGDHIFGLPGVLTSYALQSRESDLTVYGPPGIKQYIDVVLEVSESHLPYLLHVEEIVPNGIEKIFEDKHLMVYAFPLKHRIVTNGYLFKEKQSKIHLDPDRIAHHQLTGLQIKELREGGIILSYTGSPISINEIALPAKPRRTYAYCSDTVYDESITAYLSKPHLLYHEATYLDDMQELAKERMHSTAKEAGLIAKQSGAQKLLIGHFSSRYKALEPLLEEARSVFQESYLAEEGKTFDI